MNEVEREYVDEIEVEHQSISACKAEHKHVDEINPVVNITNKFAKCQIAQV